MIVIMKKGSDSSKVIAYAKTLGARVKIEKLEDADIVEIVGGESAPDVGNLRAFEGVKDVVKFDEGCKLCTANDVKGEFDVGEVHIGGNSFCFIAGPCAVENEKQIISVATSLKKAGADILRGGAFKPRTSPYSFQGLGEEGLRLLKKAKAETGLPIVSEIVDAEHLDAFDGVDIIQVGARNMQNFELLKRLGKISTPILLKRGFGATIEEWLSSAEYILANGNKNVILCERGVRTFDNVLRNSVDFGVLPVLKEKTNLPVIVDPSHASGAARFVKPLSLAAAAAGADGLMIEVHLNPEAALSDGAQSMCVDEFKDLMATTEKILPAVGKIRGRK